MGRKTREKGSIPEKVDYSNLLKELRSEKYKVKQKSVAYKDDFKKVKK